MSSQLLVAPPQQQGPPCLGTITDLYSDRCLACFSYSQCQSEKKRLQLFAASFSFNSQGMTIKEKKRAYSQRPDVKEKMRAYFQANRDKLLAQQRARREAKKKHHLSLTKEAPPA